MIGHMKAISVTVVDEDYEAFRRASKAQGRSIAQLIREAMAFYRVEKLERRARLEDVKVLPGHRPCGPIPTGGAVNREVLER